MQMPQEKDCDEGDGKEKEMGFFVFVFWVFFVF